MIDEHSVEEKVREFLMTEFMMPQVEYLSLKDELALDSLAQAELRLFLSDEFGVEMSQGGKQKVASFSCLSDIIETVGVRESASAGS